MSKKSRGINTERELIRMFWENGFASMRAAGSGSSQYPSPDVIASNNVRKIALEIKLTTENKKYFTKKEINELRYFSDKFGCESWVGIKFSRKAWYFLTLEDLQETPQQNYVVSLELAERRGLSFEELVNQ